MKIAIVGLGGVGGYYGGMLAKHYADNPDIEIYFIARGEHLQKVIQNGLKLITEDGTFQVYPTLATNNVTEIGIVDYVILATKSYDLEATILQIKACVGINTVILPLLNGIDNSVRIRTLLPETEVWNGCVYIVARLREPGIVESTSGVHRFNFGYEFKKTSDRLIAFEKIMKDAQIDATFNENIMPIIWNKFLFISTTASLTSYFDVGFRDLLTLESRMQVLNVVLEEFIQIANAEGIEMNQNDKNRLIYQLEKLPPESTSSMHDDFRAGKNTELQTLTGIVIKLGKKHGIATPAYAKIYETLNKSNGNQMIL